eukprot:261621_1
MADDNEKAGLVNNEDGGDGAVEILATKTSDLSVKASIFGNREGRVTFAWLLYTSLYWTILIWIPTLQTMSFGTEGFIIWCLGFIAMISCSYTLYEGKYPSGSTSTDSFETTSIGRYTATFLTTCVIIDICALIFIVAINDYEITSVYNGFRLGLHAISVFWASLFFYNKFYRYHSLMATKAFFIEWADIIWTIIVSYTLNEFMLDKNEEMTGVHYTYFSFICIELCGWMLPMMLLKNWGSQEYAQTVSLHLLILDLATDIPIIIVVFAYEAYKDNPLLFVDILWKSFLIIRSVSYYLVNQMLYRTADKENKEKERGRFDTSSVRHNQFRKFSTLAWIIYVCLYWTTFTFILLISENEIALNYQYYTWFGGMIGVACVYDTWSAGYYATTKRGRRMVAFACGFICTDWILHSFALLYWDSSTWMELVCMFCHAVAILWALIFFYGHALKAGKTDGWFNKAWISLMLEWFDITLMYIVIIVLHSELGTCFSQSVCCGYFVIASIKLYLWFFPIMFGYSDTEWYIHAHMVILDTFSDLPLVIILIASEGYNVHWLLFVDVTYKLIILLRCYAYHGVINLILRRVELNEKHKKQLAEANDDNAEVVEDDNAL